LSSNDVVILDTSRIDIRLPWTLINFNDPSEMRVVHDYRNIPGYQDTVSDGLALSIIHLNRVYQTGSRFTWDHWQSGEQAEEFLKDSYFIMKEKLRLLPGDPVAVKDTYMVAENGILRTSAADGVLKNDLSLDGAVMTAWLEENVSSGRLRLNPDGSFEYRAERGFIGETAFTYRTIAGGKLSRPVRVHLLVENNLPGDGFLILMPNPTSGLIWADSTSPIEFIEVFNHAGQLVIKEQVNARQKEIDLSPFPPGIYTVRVLSGGQRVTRKVVLIR
jgi:hypothetical protein